MNTVFEVYNPVINGPGKHPDLTNVDWKNGVIVRSPNWLGDAVMILPALYQLRKLLPAHCTLDVVCIEKLQDFWQCVNWVDSVISFNGKRVSPDVKQELEALNAGVSIIFPNSFGSAKDMLVTSIPVRVGRAGNLRSMLLTHRLPPYKRVPGEDTHHQVSEYFDIVESFGEIDRSGEFPPLTVASSLPDSLHQELTDFLEVQEHGRPVMVMAPGAAYGPAKQWPVAYFEALAQKWTDDGGTAIVIGTNSERPLGEQIIADNRHAFNLCGLTDLKDLVGIFSKADVCITNDSGSMHLAAACGAKGVAIFGSTSPIATGPIGGTWVIAQKEFECSPCLKRECPLEQGRYECLESISTSEVYEAVWDIMSSNSPLL